jgi:hypothetical protein
MEKGDVLERMNHVSVWPASGSEPVSAAPTLVVRADFSSMEWAVLQLEMDGTSFTSITFTVTVASSVSTPSVARITTIQDLHFSKSKAVEVVSWPVVDPMEKGEE